MTTTLDARALAEHMSIRESAMAELRRGDVSRFRERELLAAIAAADKAMSGPVHAAATEQRESERVNRLIMGDAYSAVEVTSRDRSEVRVLGARIFEQRADEYVTASVDNGPIGAILNAAGRGSRLLQRVTAVPFGGARGYVPIAQPMAAAVVGRNDGTDFSKVGVRAQVAAAVKIVASCTVGKDTLTDVPPAETALNASLAAALGRSADFALVQGADDGENSIPGFLTDGVGVATQLSAAITLDDLLTAQAAVISAGGVPDAILGDPLTIAGTIGAVDGTKLGRLPELVSLPPLADTVEDVEGVPTTVPGLPTIAAGTVIVADLASAVVPIRTAVEIFRSERGPGAFETDSVLLAGRTRMGGITFPAPGFCQVLKPAA